jgi:hypothetical protein
MPDELGKTIFDAERIQRNLRHHATQVFEDT